MGLFNKEITVVSDFWPPPPTLLRGSVTISVYQWLLVNIYIYIYIYMCMYVCMYLYIYLSIYLYLSLSIYIYIYIHMYISAFPSIESAWRRHGTHSWYASCDIHTHAPAPKVLHISCSTHLFYKHALQTVLGMGMGMNITAQYECPYSRSDHGCMTSHVAHPSLRACACESVALSPRTE